MFLWDSRVINFDKTSWTIVSNPEIAEAVLVTPDQVLVNGKGFGQVNLIAWEQTGGESRIRCLLCEPISLSIW
jgi:Flp pilus assembly secretin CpaC